jgi:hypothetical protein
MYIRKNKKMYINSPSLIFREIRLIKIFSNYHNLSYVKSRQYLRKYFRTIMGHDYNRFTYKDTINRTIQILIKKKQSI